MPAQFISGALIELNSKDPLECIMAIITATAVFTEAHKDEEGFDIKAAKDHAEEATLWLLGVYYGQVKPTHFELVPSEGSLHRWRSRWRRSTRHQGYILESKLSPG